MPDRAVRCLVGDHRRDARLTQKALAELVGVSRQTIVSIEGGLTVPNVLTAIKIGRVLAVKVEALYPLAG